MKRGREKEPASDSPKTRTSKRQKSPEIVILFSGFKDTLPDYTISFRNQLRDRVLELGGTIKVLQDDCDFDDAITHVVAPPNTRTPRVTIASLLHKWIVTPEWLLECDKQSEFVDEKLFGSRSRLDPFKDMQVYLSPDFQEDKYQFRVSKTKFLYEFIETYGKGKITNNKNKAKFWIIGNYESVDETKFKSKNIMRWNDLIQFICPSAKSSELALDTTQTDHSEKHVKHEKHDKHDRHDEVRPDMSPKEMETLRIESLLHFCKGHNLPTSKNSKKLVVQRIMKYYEQQNMLKGQETEETLKKREESSDEYSPE